MNNKVFRFKVGAFECISVRDGSMNYPIETFFSNVSIDEVVGVLGQRNLTTEHVTTPYTCLFVDTGHHRVMIDTGAGNIAESAHEFFPSVDNSASATGEIYKNLQLAEVNPAEVDTVIISHAHPDHVAGTLTDNGDLAFANARYYIARDEYEFWMSEEAETKASPGMIITARTNLAALEGRLVLVDGESEVVPGTTVLPAAGHTPGHLAVLVASADEKLLHVSDTVLYPFHIEFPDWLPVFDLSPEQAAVSKQRIFDFAAEQKALVFAHHFPPFPNLGYVRKREVGWEWQPKKISG